jgi:hypothetical protein
MTDDRPSEVLGGLPRTRPHRRSDKRAAPAAKSLPQKAATAPAAKNLPQEAATTSKRATKQPASDTPMAKARAPKAGRIRQPAQPAGTPSLGGRAAPSRPRPIPQPRRPAAPSGSEILGTAVQAAAEIAEIGLTASARALRNALARLPRP